MIVSWLALLWFTVDFTALFSNIQFHRCCLTSPLYRTFLDTLLAENVEGKTVEHTAALAASPELQQQHCVTVLAN